jgi:uncharacterized protein (UPF0333 family)
MPGRQYVSLAFALVVLAIAIAIGIAGSAYMSAECVQLSGFAVAGRC